MKLQLIRRFIKRHHATISAVCVTTLLLLSSVVAFYPILNIDIHLAQRVQELSSPFVSAVLVGATLVGNPTPMAITTVALLIFLLFTPFRALARPLALVIPADAFSLLWKYIIDRPRPALPYVEVLQTFPDPSFPSMHVVHAIVFFGFLGSVCLHQWLGHRKQWLLVTATFFFALTTIMPLSRVFMGAHWPTDVAGGLLLGGAFLVTQLKMYANQKILHPAKQSS